MRVTCPSCQAEYELPAEIAAATPAVGRRLRCAECGHVWHQPNPHAAAPHVAPAWPADALPEPAAVQMPEPAAAPAPEPSPAPETFAATRPLVAPIDSADPELRSAVPGYAAPGPSAPPAGRPAASMLVWAGWAGSVAIVLAVLALLGLERGAVIRAVPAAAPVYAAIGLAPAAHR